MDKINRIDSIELCFEECKGVLRSLAYKYKNIYNGDVDEAYANACLWLVEMYDKFDRNKASFVTYVYMIVDNRFINEGKKAFNEKKYLSNIPLDDLGIDDELYCNRAIETKANDNNSTNGQKERYKFYFELESFMNVLNEREQIIFKTFYYNNWNIKDIAKYLELSDIRVKELKKEAVKKLFKEQKKRKK